MPNIPSQFWPESAFKLSCLEECRVYVGNLSWQATWRESWFVNGYAWSLHVPFVEQVICNKLSCSSAKDLKDHCRAVGEAMKRIEPLRPFEPSIYSQVRRADVAGDLDGNPKGESLKKAKTQIARQAHRPELRGAGYGIVEFASPEEAYRYRTKNQGAGENCLWKFVFRKCEDGRRFKGTLTRFLVHDANAEAQAAVEQLTGTDLLGRKGKETEKLRQKLILLCSFCFWVVFLLRLVVVGPFTGREIFVREDREHKPQGFQILIHKSPHWLWAS